MPETVTLQLSAITSRAGERVEADTAQASTAAVNAKTSRKNDFFIFIFLKIPFLYLLVFFTVFLPAMSYSVFVIKIFTENSYYFPPIY